MGSLERTPRLASVFDDDDEYDDPVRPTPLRLADVFSADPRVPSTFTPTSPHASPAFQTPGRRGEGLHKFVVKDSPASAAKLTLEGLEHWRLRLSRELVQLKADIDSTSVLADQWCDKCGVGLEELKVLSEKKERDYEAICSAIKDIETGLGVASEVAQKPVVFAPSPIFVKPRPSGHPASGKLLGAVGNPTLYQKPIVGTSARDLSRHVARKSSILVNSPDVAKKLVF